MALYGNTDSNANKTKVEATRGNGPASASSDMTVVFVDATEADLAENKARGVSGPGWWNFHTYDQGGMTRTKAECLAVISNPEANANESQADDTIAADVSVIITINTQPATQAVTVGDALALSVAAISTPPGDASTLQYQWQKLGTNGSWTNIGANQPTYDVASYATTDAGSYRVKLTTSTGAAEVISATAVVTTA
jgi:hypothetical protein